MKMLAAYIAAAVVTVSSVSVHAKPPAQVAEAIIKAANQASKKGELEEAARLYETAIVADPANVSAYVGLGKAQAALERPKSAKRYFATAVKIDPNNLMALEAQAGHDITLGDLAAAEKNINRLKRLCVNGCSELSNVLKAYDGALDDNRARVLGQNAVDGR